MIINFEEIAMGLPCICKTYRMVGMLAVMGMVMGWGQATRSEDWLTSSKLPSTIERAQVAHDTAIKRAEEVWLNAQKTAKQNYLKSVEGAFSTAVGLKKTDEARELKKIKDQLTQELADIEMKLKGPSAVKSIAVDALIDGNSELWITPTGMYWKSLGGAAKPGNHEGANAATYINGTAWKPVWKGGPEGTGADSTEPYAFPLGGQPNFTLQVVAVGGGVSVKDPTSIIGMDVRDPVKIRTEGMDQVVSIPDTQGGSRWYRLKLTKAEK